MSEEIKRLRYFDRQVLLARDFTAEQEYHKEMRRRLNRSLHTVGVADGLLITKESDNSIRVSFGTAIDTQGQEIVLLQDEIHTIEVEGDATRYVTIQYGEGPTDIATDGVSPEESTRIMEKGIVAIETDPPAELGMQLILGVVTIVDGIVKAVTNGTPPNHRRVTGESSVLEYVDRAVGKVNERVIQDRRQFVPLLAYSLKGVEYRDGRNATIPTGDAPVDVAFDGTHIWVANLFSNNLSKIDAVTNGVVATIALADRSGGVTFDGTHLWVANSSSNDLSKINVVTNDIVATVALDYTPGGMAFDGSHLWIATGQRHTIIKINVATDNVTESFSVGNHVPGGIAFDGEHIWVADFQFNEVLKIEMTTNTIVATIAVDRRPGPLAFDGSHIWVVNTQADKVSKINVMTDTVAATVQVGNSPIGIAFDGTYIWVVNQNSNNVSKIDITTNSVVAVVPVGDLPTAITFDGSHVWIANSGSDNVSKVIV